MTITSRELRKTLDYNQRSGVFTWKIARRGVRIGDTAGCVAVRGKRRYIVIRLGKLYYAHRLAFLWMTGKWPAKLVDHEDNDGLNNKWSNIRPATHSQNNYNKAAKSDNTSGYVGVHQRPDGVFVSQITARRKTKTIGAFDTAEEAARAHDYEASLLHGEFAYLNFPDETPKPYSKSKIRRDKFSCVYRGVYMHQSGRYTARVGNKHIGYFDDPREAAAVRDEAAKQAYGDKAVLNFA